MGVHVGPPVEEVDYLVIGSGFGGSVAAAALAEAGRHVCVLERGKAYPPGSFPRTPSGMAANFWDPSAGLHGLFNVWHFDGLSAVVASGLGGGSLVYANVLLEKAAGTAGETEYTQPCPTCGGDERWPFGHGDLAHHYDEIRRFLDVQTLPPELVDRWSPKTRFFERHSEGEAHRAPLAVQFVDPETGRPAVGAPLPHGPNGNVFGPDAFRRTCRMIGECDIGCNEGAKNSMDHTYLSLALHHDAVLCVSTEVRLIERDPDADLPFTISYVVHGDEHSRCGPAAGTLRARHVVLAAGALGSTYLMLKNRTTLRLSARATQDLGARFCANGDLLAFAMPRGDTDFAPTRGPVITSYRMIDGSGPHRGRRMYLQDGGFPLFMTWLLKAQDAPGVVVRGVTQVRTWLRDRLRRKPDTDVGAELGAILGRSTRTGRSLPLLGMGTDIPNRRLSLQQVGTTLMLACHREGQAHDPFFPWLLGEMRELCGRLSATMFPRNPVQRAITVHPLGGCPMSTTHLTGVVDGFGRVHDAPGLWITDGSVMPGPIGANPSLTIAAFARRAATRMLADDYDAGPRLRRESVCRCGSRYASA